MKKRLTAALTCAGVAALACSSQPEPSGRADSTTNVVASEVPLWGADQKWIVDPKPIADIGADSGASQYMLDQVTGAQRLADGRIAVAEFTVNLHYYHATGAHDTTLVLRGEGPGELDLISRMLPWRGDSVALFGGALSTRGGSSIKVLILDNKGKFGRQFQLQWPSWVPNNQVGGMYRSPQYVQATTADGSFVIRADGALQKGAQWSVAPFYRVSADGTHIDTLGFLDIGKVQKDERSASGVIVSLLRSNAPNVSIHGNRMYFGNGDQFDVNVYDLDAVKSSALHPSQVFHSPAANTPVTSEMRERLRNLMLSKSRRKTDSARTDAYFDALPSSATLPAFQRLIADEDGNLWAEHQRFNSLPLVKTLFTYSGGMPDDPAVANSWSIFSADGKLLGDATTPAGLAVSQIGKDWMLGLWSDSLGVQHVRMHHIRKSQE